MAKTSLSVIIPSKNSGETLEDCLRSVVDSKPHDKDILVVDGSSTDNTSEILEKFKGRVRVVFDDGRGVNKARNFGVENTDSEIIAFVDSNVICERQHFQKYLDFYNEHGDIGAVDTAGIHPPAGTKVQRLGALFWKMAEGPEVSPTPKALRGWSMSCRRGVFDAVGGFPWIGCEDIYFSYEARLKGYKLATIETKSWKIPRRTLTALFKEMRHWGYAGAYFYDRYKNLHVLYEDNKERKLFKVFKNAVVLNFVAYLLAPVSGIKYLKRSKSLELYIYFIVRQYSWLTGFVSGLWEARHSKANVFGY